MGGVSQVGSGLSLFPLLGLLNSGNENTLHVTDITSYNNTLAYN